MTESDSRSVSLAPHGGKVCAIVLCGLAGFAAFATMLELLGVSSAYVVAALPLFALIAVAVTAYGTRTGDPARFTTAGRDVPPVISALAGMATALPSVTFLSLAALLYGLGFDGLALALGPALGFLLAGALVTPYFARSKSATLADFVGSRFGTVPRLLAVATVVLCSLLVAVAALGAFAGLASRAFDIPFAWALAAGVAIVLVSTLPGGMNGATWTGGVEGVIVLVAVLVPVVFLIGSVLGPSLPQIAYGELLSTISGLERSMIENGVASAQTLKPHVNPFLQLNALNFDSLILSLAAGTVVLPHLAGLGFTAATARDARSASSWTLALLFLVLITVPVYSALAKLDVYRLIAAPTALSSLPDWVGDLSRQGSFKVHGVSLALAEAVGDARRAGAADAIAVGRALGAASADLATGWNSLGPPVQTLLLDQAAGLPRGGEGESWHVFRETLLPAIATASGNKQGLLTLAAVEVDPEALIVELPSKIGQPLVLSGALIAGALAAAAAVAAAALVAAATTLGHDVIRGLRSPWAVRAILVLAALAVAAAAMTQPGDIAAFVPAAFSLAAAGLFPAVVLGIWWKRANGWGAALAMIGGLAVGLYYLVGQRYFPLAVHDIWAQFSNAAPGALKKLADLETSWRSLEGDAKAAAWTALEAHARGTPLLPGAVNWFGVSPLASAVFALPVGLLLLILGSLVTPRPSAAQQEFVETVRRPEPFPPSLLG